MVINGIKHCPKCKQQKPTEQFYRSSIKKDGCSSYCKSCQNLRSTSYARENKDKIPTTGYALKRRYGITTEEYALMLQKQNNTCAICLALCKTGRNLAVDHCHNTGKVRGLLCSRCNQGLGNFQDSQVLLQRAKEYLKDKCL